MTRVIQYSDDVLGWKRKPGPLKTWRNYQGPKKIDGKNLKFSIQEIPENRYDDVLDLMCSTFVKDEPICNYLNIVEDPEAISDFCKLWSFALQKGSVVGAFILHDNGTISNLAAVNMTLVACDVTEKTLSTGIQFRSKSTTMLLQFMHDLEAEKSPRDIYKVDKWLTAFGLCVDEQYRGQGLGLELLSSRNEMSLAYDIEATSTVFTAVAAQKSASRAGFQLLLERNYVDIKKQNGSQMFPGIKHKSVKLMGKKF